MSDFEFISIVISIVVGLTVTRVLGGIASVIEYRGRLRMNWLSVGWAVQVLLWSVAFWLGTVNDTRSLESWTLGGFGTLLSLAVALYFLAAVVLPTHIHAETDLVAHFAEIRRPFFLIFAAWVVVSTASVLIWGVENLLRAGLSFWIGQAAGLFVALLGAFTAHERVHVAILTISIGGTLAFILVRLYVI